MALQSIAQSLSQGPIQSLNLGGGTPVATATPPSSQPVDQQALTLTHAIALAESSKDGKTPNYNAVGDNGTSVGAYQWNGAGKFATDAKNAGLDPTDMSPENQDKVAYAAVKKMKDAGLQPAEIASEWNSGSPDNYQNHSGTTIINGKTISYDTPAYVQKVKKYYQQLSSQSTQQNGYVTPPSDTSSSDNSTDSSDTSGDNIVVENDNGLGDTAKSIGKGILSVGNFLFPVVKDVVNDVQGKSTKSFLQQAGDTALSALPFIPGLGEAGDAVEGAVDVGKGADAAAQGAKATPGILEGLLGKTGATVAKDAAVGYGTGVASNLSQGQGLGQSFAPNSTNILSTIIGAGTPLVLKGAGKALQSISGIDPTVANELTKMGTEANPEDKTLMEQYNKAAQVHATDVRTPSVENVAASNLDTAAKKITENTKAAGAIVGAAKKAASTLPLQNASTIADDFAQKVEDQFGLHLTSDEAGNVTAKPISGSLRNINPNDVSRIEAVATQINKLGTNATVGNASDIIANIDDDLNFNKNAYGQSVSPVDGVLSKLRGTVNDAVRSSAPDLASANDKFAGLKNLQEDVRQIAGNKLQRGELLMKRIFSDNSQDSLDLFNKIKDETGIDLTKHAVFAKNAIDNYGSRADKSLLAQMISGASEGHTGLIQGALNIGKSALKNTIANPERISKKLLSGGSTGLLNSLLTKGALEGSRVLTSK
jgi:hypothetical protein